MPKWAVTLPITGSIYVEVEAASEKEAIEQALCSDLKPWSKEMQWETHEHVVRGNVFYGMQCSAEATPMDDDWEGR